MQHLPFSTGKCLQSRGIVIGACLPGQGSFIVDELTELVEEAVYQEFERISEPGGEQELMRSTDEEKDQQVKNVDDFRKFHHSEAGQQLLKLQQVARERKNTFESLMDAVKACSLGSMSHALYEVGGEYRRNM